MSEESILEDLGERIEFHHKWRLIWSTTYFVGASITVIAGALATATAGLVGDAEDARLWAGGFALIATVGASLEKVLKLREKWDLHRNSQLAFEIIRLKAAADIVDIKGVVGLIEKVSQAYSLQLDEVDQAATTEGA